MSGYDRIATEVLQKMSPSLAWEYMLVPFDGTTGRVKCYGEHGRDYGEAVQELAVLYGLDVSVTQIASEDVRRLLNQYYRTEGDTDRALSRSISEIDTGQGFLIGLIEEAFDNYASDVHIEPYEERCRVRMRIDGKLIERYVIEKANYASLINQIKILANLDISEKRLPQDGRILYDHHDKKFDVRVSSLPTIYGEKVVLRLLTRHVELLELANLGFSEKQLEDYCRSIQKPYGMILICGPTGSGKSTTLYATLRRLNRENNNLVTIEDPVEYTLEGINQVQLKEEIGLTFSSALRTFLRQDPDIIMLGEIRDAETAQMAIRSSLTGHLILSTIHTNSAWGSISRLIDMGVHPYLLSSTMVMCVAQRLVRLLCPYCKHKETLPENMRQYGMEESYVPVGCPKCYYTGYSGRKAIYEVIPIDEELSVSVKNAETDVEQLLAERGITSLRSSGLEMLKSGDTSVEELMAILNN